MVRLYHERMTRKILFALAMACLVGLGAVGLAHSDCFSRASFNALSAAFRKTLLCASIEKGVHDYETQRQQRQQAAAAKSGEQKSAAARMAEVGAKLFVSKPAATEEEVRPQPTTAQTAPVSQTSKGQQIANGHAFGKHAREMEISGRGQMADEIDRIIRNAGSYNVRHLERGRTAYWDGASDTVVIVDPNTADGGTAFKPNRGRRYFESLR